MLSPNTATPGFSIWDSVGRRTYEGHVVALSKLGCVPGSHVYNEAEWPQHRGPELLPFGLERQIADDLAFIAAYDYGVKYVTAATVEASGDPPGLIVRLAANEGIQDCVKRAFEKLFQTLKSCALKELSVETCAEDAFDTVVVLNTNRIFGRLESRWFRRPLHERGTRRDPLSQRLKQSFTSHAPAGRFPKQSTDHANIFAQVDNFNLRFLELEESEESTRISVLKTVVKEAFLITLNGVSLASRLRTLGIAPDARTIEEVNKLASYWRISQSLANLCRARSYRMLFANSQLETLHCFQPSLPISTGGKHFVHAEIQTIVHYETSSSVWPRVIGSSKGACFLCDAFIKAHGFFHISKAHRQVYHQWTVPDLKDYSKETLARLRKSLVLVDRAVLKELQMNRGRKNCRPFPVQSSINLQKPILLTPSLSTICPSEHESARTVTTIVSYQEPRLLTPGPALGTVNNNTNNSILTPAKAAVPSVDSSPTRTPINSQSIRDSADEMAINQGAVDTQELHLPLLEAPNIIEALTKTHEAKDGISLAVTPTSPADLDLGWLNLSIELEGEFTVASTRSVAAWSASNAYAFPKAEVTVSRGQDNHRGLKGFTNLADMLPGEEQLVERSDDEEGLELTIANGSEDIARVKLIWLAA